MHFRERCWWVFTMIWGCFDCIWVWEIGRNLQCTRARARAHCRFWLNFQTQMQSKQQFWLSFQTQMQAKRLPGPGNSRARALQTLAYQARGVVLIASGSGKFGQNLQCARARAHCRFWLNFQTQMQSKQQFGRVSRPRCNQSDSLGLGTRARAHCRLWPTRPRELF